MTAEIDLAILNDACGGNQAVIGTALRLFVTTTRTDLAHLGAAIDAQDAALTNTGAHRIKGAARIIGATGISHHAQTIETAALDPVDWLVITAALPGLATAFAAVEAYIATTFPA